MADEEQGSTPEQPESVGTSTTIAPVKKPEKPKRKPRHLPPYRVLLHNDDVSTFEHVIQSIVMLTPIQTQEALIKAIEAHETGVALLLVTHLERAELYSEQFRSRNVTVTIEPAEE